jgi:hypothetical protein
MSREPTRAEKKRAERELRQAASDPRRPALLVDCPCGAPARGILQGVGAFCARCLARRTVWGR